MRPRHTCGTHPGQPGLPTHAHNTAGEEHGPALPTTDASLRGEPPMQRPHTGIMWMIEITFALRAT
jgi:hypothetical protein